MSKENHLFFKAPFRTHFSLQEGNVLASGKDYLKFWQKAIKADLGNLNSKQNYSVEYLHNIDVENAIQFESVAENSNVLNVFTPQVIKIIPGKWVNEIIDKYVAEETDKFFSSGYKETLTYVPESCTITLFKNTVGSIEIVFRTPLKNAEISQAFIEMFESWTNEIMRKLIRYFYDNFIFLFIKKLNKLDVDFHFISPVYKHYGFPDIHSGKSKVLIKRSTQCALPLWVSRVLVVQEMDEGFDELVKRWIITTKNKDEIISELRKKSHDEKSLIYLGWMHSLFVTSLDSAVFEDASQALELIQYYYAVLDNINMNLSRIIGISHKKKDWKETRFYKSFLEEMIFVSDLNEIEFTDVSQSLQRNRAYFFNDLIYKWTVNSLFENVARKIKLCKENINKIYQKAFNRSQRVAELLLFFISGFAILEFLKGLSEYFWTPENMEDDVWGLYSLGRSFDPNTMLWFGISIFLLLFILYTTIINKRK